MCGFSKSNLTFVFSVAVRIGIELGLNNIPLNGVVFVCDADGNVLTSSLGPVFINCAGKTAFAKHESTVCVLAPSHMLVVALFRQMQASDPRIAIPRARFVKECKFDENINPENTNNQNVEFLDENIVAVAKPQYISEKKDYWIAGPCCNFAIQVCVIFL